MPISSVFAYLQSLKCIKAINRDTANFMSLCLRSIGIVDVTSISSTLQSSQVFYKAIAKLEMTVNDVFLVCKYFNCKFENWTEKFLNNWTFNYLCDRILTVADTKHFLWHFKTIFNWVWAGQYDDKKRIVNWFFWLSAVWWDHQIVF